MIRRAALAALLLAAPPPPATAQGVPLAGQRFVVAPGEQAAVMGSAADGLEVWAWPLQLLSDYHVRFRVPGRVQPLEAAPLLARVERDGPGFVRVYSGPDFVVRERLFTPLHARGAEIAYEVEGRPDVQVEVRFRPSLNLMWPGGIGGQEALWDDRLGGYAEREPVHGFAALVRSPETAAHDSTANVAGGRDDGLALVLQPRAAPGDAVRRARVFVTAEAPGSGAVSAMLEAQAPRLRAEAQAHADAVLAGSLRITTPDPQVNAALADAELALDQAWVCAPDLGCGEVAGYGPSRPGRRPQYAWFFAGDGLVATEGLLATGRYDRAREELAFVARYQNAGNGMIWHEMSLSAPLIDWERRYPYMFVHVDITDQYLSTLADYLKITGDLAFVRAHWAGIAHAWSYARSLVDPATGLPTIPAGKQGQNEQAQLRDDVRLSSAWLDAAEGFARLAHAAGRPALAVEGEAAAARARRALSATAWDTATGFWSGGHTAAGAPVQDARSDATGLLSQGVLTPAQAEAALDRLATPDFQTDWGVRSLSSASPDYDPNAYSQGAVWALGTSGAATAFWAAHRPLTAWADWRGLAGWNTLDAPGHLHEVLAGDLYHPERESVPAQTWSSAGLLTGMTQGLLGLQVDGAARRLAFAPHLPGGWDRVSLERVAVGASQLSLTLARDDAGLALQVMGAGAPVQVEFAPEIPLGARLLGAEVDGRPAAATLERHAQDQHARLAFTAGAGATRVTIRYAGGVRVAPVTAAPEIGDPSRNLQLAAAEWRDGRLLLRGHATEPERAQVELITGLKLTAVEGADATPTPHGYRLAFRLPAARGAGGYAPVQASVAFAP